MTAGVPIAERQSLPTGLTVMVAIQLGLVEIGVAVGQRANGNRSTLRSRSDMHSSFQPSSRRRNRKCISNG